MCKNSVFISITDGTCEVEKAGVPCENPAQLMKPFPEQRCLNFGTAAQLLDGAELPAGVSGASDLLLEKLRDALAKKDDRLLVLYNFLERLDEAVDLRPIFEALNAAGRQVWIAVPHYYGIKTLEETPDVTIITL